MVEIEKPKIVIAETNTEGTYGKFVWEPLERGYGITIGNSLRRVLLSSLTGAAANAIKIEGVLHEFSTIPGVLEDVTDIVLNVKGLCLKLYSDEPKILRLEKSGEGELTAADIVADSDVEILNKDLHIATLDTGADFSMEIYVDSGRGYVAADRNKSMEHVIGMIPIDAIYSPITKVKFGVTDTRVGNVTDYDKLTIEVWTDGSIRPDEAINKSAAILISYLRLFQNISGNEPIDEEDDQIVDIVVMDEASEDLPSEEDEAGGAKQAINMMVEDLDLTVRPSNCLKRANIQTIAELVQLSADDLFKIQNFGRKSLDEITKKLADLGLALKESEKIN